MFASSDTDRMVRAVARSLLLVAGVALVPACHSREEPPPPPPAHGGVTSTSSPTTAASAVRAARPERVAPGQGCMSAECHADFKQLQYVHGPVAAQGCDACHGPEQPGHKFPLKRAGTAVCSFCHAALTGKSTVHAALKQGNCTRCHNPHGSSTKFLLTAASIHDLCRQCHPPETSGSVVHGPYAAGGCTACHAPHEADNPQLTLRTGPEHCYRCHTEIKTRLASARSVHPPAAADCLKCHEPHVAPYPRLLREPLDDSCKVCHKQVDDDARTATSRHGAVFTQRRCLNCHDPHNARNPALLRQSMPDLCLACHDQPLTAYDGHTVPEMKTRLTTSRFLHGPVRAGECQACHQVHGSSNTKLLKTYFTSAFYSDFELTNYALCFSCHEKALVLDEQTSTLTGFRNGSRNLHYVHVNRVEKGRTCKACHEIHGSSQPQHVADAVPFEGGGWALPIRFKRTTTGGGCAPGCHQPYDYDREKPVTLPSR